MNINYDYLAGLFDGEGWFSITRSKGSRSRAKREWAYQCHANITMREEFLVKAYLQEFGGTVNLQKSRSEKHSPYWGWRVTGMNAANFATKMYPHLMAKNRQALCVAQFQEQKILNGNKPLSDERYNFYEESFQLLKTLNMKGVGK